MILTLRENLEPPTIMYKLVDTEILREAFAPATETAEIRSALSASKSIRLQIAAAWSVRSRLRPHCFAELAAVACGSPK
jgi:hypothetical protein